MTELDLIKQDGSSGALAARVLAFYLPQFHPIPENDAWWGKGFTEWTNVSKAQSYFRGHVQPRLPTELGFYDLRVAETREAQADLAREHGVEGFCYWHYWFGGGKRILERPFAEVLASGKPDYPFCLTWANHTWDRTWNGRPNSILVEQRYPGADDEKAHFDAVLPALTDPRYFRVDGRPLFGIFHAKGLPNAAKFIDHWRSLATLNGLPDIYFVALANDLLNPIYNSFDAVVNQPPHDFRELKLKSFRNRLLNRLLSRDFGPSINRRLGSNFRLPTRFSYRELVDNAFSAFPPGDRFLPCVVPGWDDTPRRGRRGGVYVGSTPELFWKYMLKAIEKLGNRPSQTRIIFIKAWNEWAEGNYMEPDREYGRQYLEVLRAALTGR